VKAWVAAETKKLSIYRGLSTAIEKGGGGKETTLRGKSFLQTGKEVAASIELWGEARDNFRPEKKNGPALKNLGSNTQRNFWKHKEKD